MYIYIYIYVYIYIYIYIYVYIYMYMYIYIYIYVYIYMYIYISLGTLVPNSRDRQGKLWLPSVLENNLTITCPSNTGHKSLSTELLAL